MSYTAIVLDADSQNLCIEKAIALGLLPLGHPAKCHHVTICLGFDSTANMGEPRELTVTHYGTIEGRIAAFRVSGASDSANAFPHVTIAVFGDAKPFESNRIISWLGIEPFTIRGEMKYCR